MVLCFEKNVNRNQTKPKRTKTNQTAGVEASQPAPQSIETASVCPVPNSYPGRQYARSAVTVERINRAS